MDASSLQIERLTTIDQFRACEALQRAAWGMDAADVVPLHLLVTFEKSGGLVLGAFDASGEIVGTLFGFLGTDVGAPGRTGGAKVLKHCSHMMGVREDWRGRGVGRRLKLAQRDHALEQGLDRVTWTFDPLESLNASLNIRRLGAVSRTYIRDLYGEMSDARNAALGSDRFRLDWWIRSRHVVERLDGRRPDARLAGLLDRGGVLLNRTEVRPSGMRAPAADAQSPTAEVVLVEIPADVQAIKATDLELARTWRAHARETFEGAFADGYTVVDFASETDDAERRSYYVLRRGFEVER